MSLVYFFDYATVTASTITGWCVIAAFVLSSFSGAVYMLYFIERAKKNTNQTRPRFLSYSLHHPPLCMHHIRRLAFINNLVGCELVWSCSDGIVRKRELREIPIARYRSTNLLLLQPHCAHHFKLNDLRFVHNGPVLKNLQM
ncbi:hypothetical protein HYC85_016321 [Camellia sinensis]|uniref:Uncharacterized protein n=1 Tax=Camellia sinensis TaxID=4442 RepID=A0A7J7GZA1_CAMSI|nr:hypothetical protein HYC85_016321 [Camellia sinensis]